MNSELISIGKMADMNGISIATLRLYDKMDLLKPRFVDTQSGYRYYDIRQNSRLDMIAYMKELGMSLAEISSILKKEDIALVEQILAQKNEQIHQNIRDLKSQHEAVERAISSIERYRKSPVTGTVSLEYIDRRYIFAMPCTENFYELGIESYENTLINMRKHCLEYGFKRVHSYNVGTTIKKFNFEADNFIPDQVFIFLDSSYNNLPYTHIIDSGMYACTYLDSFDDELDYAKQLIALCKQRNYKISGDYLCEVLTEFNVFDSDSRSMFVRLQIPISFE